VRVVKLLVSPRWLLWHLMAALAIGLFVFLGKWQWNRAMAKDGTLQNLFYAFNWWVFAALVVYGWVVTLRQDVQALDAPPQPEDAPSRVTLPALYAKPRPADLDDPIEDDPELAAYNAYLAQLNERSAR
jgi:DNA-binding transcriptional regulator of glucitol operon